MVLIREHDIARVGLPTEDVPQAQKYSKGCPGNLYWLDTKHLKDVVKYLDRLSKTEKEIFLALLIDKVVEQQILYALDKGEDDVEIRLSGYGDEEE